MELKQKKSVEDYLKVIYVLSQKEEMQLFMMG